MANWETTENEQFEDVEWVAPQTSQPVSLQQTDNNRPLGPGPVITTVQPPIPVIVGPAPLPLQFPLNPGSYPAYYQVPMTAYPVMNRDANGELRYDEQRLIPIPLPLPLPVPGPVFGPYPRPPFYGPFPYGRPPFYGPFPYGRPPFIW